MLKLLRINAITKADRNRLTSEVSEAIGRSGGWITDSYFYSNLSLCLNFETTRDHVQCLLDALHGLEITLSDASETAARAILSDAALSDESEITGTLEITFVHNDPDQKRVVPAIPG